MIFSTFFTSTIILSPMAAPSFSIVDTLQEEEVTAAEKELKDGTFSNWGRSETKERSNIEGKFKGRSRNHLGEQPVLSQFSTCFYR